MKLNIAVTITLVQGLLPLYHTDMVIVRYDGAVTEFLHKYWLGQETQQSEMLLGLDGRKRRDLCDALLNAKQFKFIPLDGQFWEYPATEYLVDPVYNFQQMLYDHNTENPEPTELEKITVSIANTDYTVKAVECVRTANRNWFVTRARSTNANNVFLIERQLSGNRKLVVTALIEHNARLILPFVDSPSHLEEMEHYFLGQIASTSNMNTNPAENPTKDMSLCYLLPNEHVRLCSVTFDLLRKAEYRFMEGDVLNLNYIKIFQRCVSRNIHLRVDERILPASVLPCIVNREYNLLPQFYLLANLEMSGSAFILIDDNVRLNDTNLLRVVTVIVNVDVLVNVSGNE